MTPPPTVPATAVVPPVAVPVPLPAPVTVPTSVKYVTLRSSNGQTLTGSGTLADGWEPTYPALTDAAVTLHGSNCKLRWTSFDLEEGGADCSYDYVTVAVGQLTRKYCGQALPPTTIYSGENMRVTVSLHSDKDVQKSGFELTFKCDVSEPAPVPALPPSPTGTICRDLRTAEGSVESAWYDEGGADYSCAWYAAEPGRCASYGSGYRRVYTAAEACCHCGGGAVTHAGVDFKKASNAYALGAEQYLAGVHPAGMLFARRGAAYEVTVRASLTRSVRARLLHDGAPYPSSMYRVKESALGGEVRVQIVLEADAAIGLYTLAVESQEGLAEAPMMILVNAAEAADAAYMNAEARAEYVDSTDGVIFVGSAESPRGGLHSYDQFDWTQVAVAARSLRRMPVKDRGDLVLVARHLSYAVNKDICYGRWSGSYTTGHPAGGYKCSEKEGRPCRRPGHWRSMSELFELHTSLGYQRVQFCQCWVFAAAYLTCSRALGIPARVTSVFNSAKDEDSNRAIDRFYRFEDGALVPAATELEHDSVWNFHTWNDVWFRRTDIDCAAAGAASGCANGWQAVDATPQLRSAGGSGVVGPEYQMGPASLNFVRANLHPTCPAQERALATSTAGKHGCYDSEFVISEVNANVNQWVEDAASPTGWKSPSPSHRPQWERV
eukprot:TRINITY_DN4305_c0_g1_i2.p1 TRINITY_DN4305_c0_g1~~TRINITY_DN4305_c0_g1_i2.p1  ORF type:complete len:665 (+),score=118.53 TRINITY_DN4305_c0_g1_i2:372-2366(+)